MTDAIKDEWIEAGIAAACAAVGRRDDVTRAIVAAVAPLIRAELEAENERLKEAIKRQAGAVKTLQACEDREIARLRKTHQQAHVATRTLDSEREANAVLTAENDALRAELAQARAQIEALRKALEWVARGCEGIRTSHDALRAHVRAALVPPAVAEKGSK